MTTLEQRIEFLINENFRLQEEIKALKCEKDLEVISYQEYLEEKRMWEKNQKLLLEDSQRINSFLSLKP